MMRSLPLLLLCAFLAACGVGGAEDESPGDACTVHLSPGPDDQGTIQSALIGASAGSVICFDEGTYHLTDGLFLSVPAISLRPTDGPVTLDFSGQAVDAPGLDVTGDDVTIDGLAFRNTTGDAIRLIQVDNVKVRRLRIEWNSDAPPVAEAHGISVLGASNVIVEACKVWGAAGNGVLVASSAGVTIRSSSVQESGGGIAVEGSSDVEQVNNRLRNNAPPAPEVEEEQLLPTEILPE